MKISFLGTGTSHGVPVAGCQCPVCQSKNPKNKRYRSSVLFQDENYSLLIDISPEFRLQAIREEMTRPDAVLVTHAHNDHIGGLDDLRIFTRNAPIPIYSLKDTCQDIIKRFPYFFNPIQKGGGVPNLIFNDIQKDISFRLGPFRITPLEIWHGKLEISGFRINNTAYITDASHIPEKTLLQLENLDLLVINALRDRPHSTHQTVEEALAIISRLKPKQSYLTHLCHDLDHERLSERLPFGVAPAYDGLRIDL